MAQKPLHFDLKKFILSKNPNETKSGTKFYSRKTLMSLSKNPACSVPPKFISDKFVNDEGRWVPEIWMDETYLEQKKTESSKSRDTNAESDDDGKFTFQPMRKSFQNGCHVEKPKSDHFSSRSPALKPTRLPNYRHIDHQSSRNSYKKSYEPEHDFDRYSSSRAPPRTKKFERSSFSRDGGSYQNSNNESGNGRPSMMNSGHSQSRFSNNHGGNYKSSGSSYNHMDMYDEEEPEWLLEGPESQFDTIELKGFSDDDDGDDGMPTQDLEDFKRQFKQQQSNNEEKPITKEMKRGEASKETANEKVEISNNGKEKKKTVEDNGKKDDFMDPAIHMSVLNIKDESAYNRFKQATSTNKAAATPPPPVEKEAPKLFDRFAIGDPPTMEKQQQQVKEVKKEDKKSSRLLPFFETSDNTDSSAQLVNHTSMFSFLENSLSEDFPSATAAAADSNNVAVPPSMPDTPQPNVAPPPTPAASTDAAPTANADFSSAFQRLVTNLHSTDRDQSKQRNQQMLEIQHRQNLMKQQLQQNFNDPRQQDEFAKQKELLANRLRGNHQQTDDNSSTTYSVLSNSMISHTHSPSDIEGQQQAATATAALKAKLRMGNYNNNLDSYEGARSAVAVSNNNNNEQPSQTQASWSTARLLHNVNLDHESILTLNQQQQSVLAQSVKNGIGTVRPNTIPPTVQSSVQNNNLPPINSLQALFEMQQRQEAAKKLFQQQQRQQLINHNLYNLHQPNATAAAVNQQLLAAALQQQQQQQQRQQIIPAMMQHDAMMMQRTLYAQALRRQQQQQQLFAAMQQQQKNNGVPAAAGFHHLGVAAAAAAAGLNQQQQQRSGGGAERGSSTFQNPLSQWFPGDVLRQSQFPTNAATAAAVNHAVLEQQLQQVAATAAASGKSAAAASSSASSSGAGAKVAGQNDVLP